MRSNLPSGLLPSSCNPTPTTQPSNPLLHLPRPTSRPPSTITSASPPRTPNPSQTVSEGGDSTVFPAREGSVGGRRAVVVAPRAMTGAMVSTRDPDPTPALNPATPTQIQHPQCRSVAPPPCQILWSRRQAKNRTPDLPPCSPDPCEEATRSSQPSRGRQR